MLVAWYYKIRFCGKCKIHAMTSVIIRGCSFEGANSLGERVYLSHTSMGYGSYTGYSCEFSNCAIGRYCSIGNCVRVVSATHPTNMLSTYPAFYSNSYRISYVKESKFKEHLVTENGYECEIGNDVWIGDNVLIKGGVSIGDGAVIAMGSVVLHDIKPYTIVGGVPAKEIRKRFDEDMIRELEEFQWWNKPKKWIAAYAAEFEDPKRLIRLQSENKGVKK